MYYVSATLEYYFLFDKPTNVVGWQSNVVIYPRIPCLIPKLKFNFSYFFLKNNQYNKYKDRSLITSKRKLASVTPLNKTKVPCTIPNANKSQSETEQFSNIFSSFWKHNNSSHTIFVVIRWSRDLANMCTVDVCPL